MPASTGGALTWFRSWIIFLSFLHFHRTPLGCKDQDEHSSESKHVPHGSGWSIQKEKLEEKRSAKVACGSLQRTPVVMLVCEGFFVPCLHEHEAETEEQSMSWTDLTHVFTFFCYETPSAEHLIPTLDCRWKDNADILTLFSASGLVFNSRQAKASGREDVLGWEGRVWLP